MSIRLRELYAELLTSMGEKASDYREEPKGRGTQTARAF